MTSGIKIAPGVKGSVIKNCTFKSLDVGIKGQNVDLSTANLHFQDVEQPFDISGGKANILGTRISETRDGTVGNSRIGWTPQGPALPAICDNCSAVFPSRRYAFRTSKFFGRKNLDICPICKSQAKVADGLFDLTTETIGIVAAIAGEPGHRASLDMICQQILSGETPAVEGFEQMISVSQKIRPLFDKAKGLGFNTAWYIAVFISAFMWLHPHASETEKLQPKNLEEIQESCIDFLNEILRRKIDEVISGLIKEDANK